MEDIQSTLVAAIACSTMFCMLSPGYGECSTGAKRIAFFVVMAAFLLFVWVIQWIT
jgi:hypothetical protein